MRKISPFILLLFLCACSGGSSPPPVVVAPSPPSPGTQWSMNYTRPPNSVLMQPGDYFDFPRCDMAPASAQQPDVLIMPCAVGYVERSFGNLTGAPALTLEYEITGTDPIFEYKTNPDNTCDGAATVELLIFKSPGNLNDPNARWFSHPSRQTLTLGKNTYTVPLTADQWIPIYPPGVPEMFQAALGNVKTAGFVYGGGCFAGHGVGLSKGSARFWVRRFST